LPDFGTGTETATPAIDTTNETQGTPGENNIDGMQSIPAVANNSGKTIAEQLVASGRVAVGRAIRKACLPEAPIW
jgi:phosphatidylinositol-3-phosphatase